MNLTPLRYPGGKSIMTSLFVDLLNQNDLKHMTYVEPYAGGAGTAINLLLNGNVDRIIINDANVCIYSFWHYLLKYKYQFVDRVRETEVTISEWHKQKEIVKNAQKPSYDLGFATFFLSRTNRSGILEAGPMGGNSEEKQVNAKYKIDCRYNKEDLCARMSNIIDKAGQIEVYNEDALALLKRIQGSDIIVYLDPPYYVNGKSLYMNYYTHQDHVMLSEYLKKTKNFKWVLSYDNVPEIVKMYPGFNLYTFDLYYTVQDVKMGHELLTHSKDIILPTNKFLKKQRANILLKKIV